jgi:glycolate oxidase FAD binding subunit
VQSQIRPVDERELARVLAEATNSRTPLAVAGAGSKRDVGRPVQAAAVISTGSLRGTTLYEPSEMVFAARAGTPLRQIEADLAANGQMLAFEPVDLGPMLGQEAGMATLGGVLAANLSGARRISAGAARDHLLGVRAVNGRGEIFKSGGRVMKNVTGYDIARGLSGSWGTLAVVTEVTFKVQPLPETSATLLLVDLPDEIAIEVLSAAMGSPFEVSGAVHVQAPLVSRLWHEGLSGRGRSVTAIRIENFARSVAYRAGRLREDLRIYGEVHELEDESSRAFWEELRQLSPLQGGTDPVWRISTAPSAAPKVAAAIANYMGGHAIFDWSGGLIWMEVTATADAGAADVRRVIATHGGHATLIRADAATRAAVEVFQPLEAGVAALSQRLKSAFDPAGILNPGRMYPAF